MNHILHIIKNNQVEKINIISGQTLNLKAEADTIYRLVDENGQLIAEPKSASENKDLLLFLENSDVPNVVLEDYFSYSIIEDFQTLQQLNATFATVSHAPEVILATQGSASSPLPFILGGLAVMGVGMAFANQNSDETSSENHSNNVHPNQPNNTPVNNTPVNNTPPDTKAPELKVTINPVPNINNQNINQDFVLSGTINTNEALQNSEVKVIINSEEKSASVIGNEWSLNIAGSELAKNQGSQNIGVKLSASDLAGNLANAENNINYEVDSLAPNLSVNINPVPNINSQNINQDFVLSGTINTNEALQNSEVKVMINGEEKSASVIGNEWSLNIAGSELAKNQGSQNIGVKLLATDLAGNSANAENNINYEVDTIIEKPIIRFNSITEDNIINLSESQNAIKISGTVEHFHSGDKLSIQIGQSQPIEVAIQDNGQFEFLTEGQTLINHQEIKATLNTKDLAGNMASASQSINYQVDLEAPTPNIVLNKIAEDNIINIEESKKTTTDITGTVSNLEENSRVIVVCSCTTCTGTREKIFEVPVLSNNTFKLEMDTDELLIYDKITAKVETFDHAKNKGTNESTQNYTKDLIINPPEITINSITPVNRTEWLKNDFKISGTLKIDADIQKVNTQVKIKIGNEIFYPTYDNQSWDLKITQKQLESWNNQTVNIEAQIEVTDNAGNSAKGTPQSASLPIDITPPEVQIHLNPIGRINTENDLIVSGKVTGEFKSDDKVNIQIGSHTLSNIKLQNDGSFATTIEKQYLVGQNTVFANIQTQDNLGNIGSASDTKNYIAQTAQDIQIQFNTITGDDLINVSEKQQEITISGKLAGDYANTQKGKTIELTVNQKALQATIQDDLSFSFKVSGEDLIKQPNYTLTAKINDNGRIISGNKEYSVDANAIAEIHLDDVHLNALEALDTVRLSGKINFNDSVLKYGYNKDFIYSVILKIGNKSFEVGIDKNDQSFFLDLSKSEYKELKGQNIDYEFKVGNFTIRRDDGTRVLNSYFSIQEDGQNNIKAIWRSLKKPNEGGQEIAKLTLDFDDIQGNQLVLDDTKKIVVSGFIKGAKSGEEINLLIGTKNYQTIVKDDLSFNVEVKNEDLKNTSKIEATLLTKNKKGENIYLYDEANIYKEKDILGLFVNKHENIPGNQRVIKHSDTNYNIPYFIDGVDTRSIKYFLDYNKTPFGENNQTPTIKYYFAKTSDYLNGLKDNTYNNGLPAVDHNTYLEYSDEYKQMIREIYQDYENKVNLKFVEANSFLEADTIFMEAKLINRYEKNGAFANYGQNIVVKIGNTKVDGAYYKHVVYHEIFHTLGGKHIDANPPNDLFNRLDYTLAETTTETSVMSYNMEFSEFSGRTNLSLYDLAYLHWRFGVNKNRNIGNDVYTFKKYNPMVSDGDIYIWDANGIDTFDASKEKDKVYLDLTPGSWIYRGEISDTFLIKDKVEINKANEFEKFFPEFVGKTFSSESIIGSYTKNIYVEGQAFIGYGTQIENAIGSDHHDIIKGNKADNNLFGGAGNDEIYGQLGHDYLDGGKGEDKMYGGLGDDIYIIDNSADVVIENANEGADMVYSAVNYTLTVNVENLQLKGQALSGTGNELDNLITGNDHNNELYGLDGHDELNGGRGSDTLTGGNGNDKFVFNSQLDGSIDTITDFNINEDKIVLDKKIFVGIDTQIGNLFQTYLNYDSASGLLSFDPDANNSADPIYFAKLNPNLNLGDSNIEII